MRTSWMDIGSVCFGLYIGLIIGLLGCGSSDRDPVALERERWTEVVDGYKHQVEELQAELAKLRQAPPATLEEADERIRTLKGDLAKLEAERQGFRDQARAEARETWARRLIVVSLLGAVGLAIAAWWSPVGKLRLAVGALGMFVVPFVVRAFDSLDRWGWLAPVLVAAIAGLALLPTLRKHLGPLVAKLREETTAAAQAAGAGRG